MATSRLPLQTLSAQVQEWPYDRSSTAARYGVHRYTTAVAQALRHFGIDHTVAFDAAQSGAKWRARLRRPWRPGRWKDPDAATEESDSASEESDGDRTAAAAAHDQRCG